MGGMQALEWAVAYPERVASAIPIACTARHSAQQIAFNEVGRQAIMADPDWSGGNYYGGKPPANGLALARMVGHITYMSDQSMREKFGRRLRTPDQFEVESYLKYRGYKFVDRFDANSYIYITKAMDDFDLTQRGALPTLFERARTRFLLISFSSDWLYPSYQSLEIVSALRSRNADVAYCNLEARYGHDSFLVEVEEQTELVRGFLNNTFKEEARQGTQAAVREVYGRRDFAIIGELVEPETRVLDLGCGEGELLAWLKEHKDVDGRGVELTGARVQKAIARGVSCLSGRSGKRGRGLSRPGLRLRHPVARPCRRCATRCVCCAACCAWAGARLWRSPTSGITPCACPRCEADARPKPSCSRTTGGIRPTSISSPCSISRRWRKRSIGAWSGAFFFTASAR